MKECWHQWIRYLVAGLAVSVLGLSPAQAAESRGAKATRQTAPESSGSQASPSIQIGEKTHDFGEVMEGAQITHVFQVKNTGSAPLQITQVRPG